MTKAERDEIRALAGESEWEIYDRSGGPPISCSLNDLLDQIDALEAQIAQRDERIRLLREALGGITCSCGRWACTDNCNLMIALMAFRIDDAIKNADAKEGEGK